MAPLICRSKLCIAFMILGGLLVGRMFLEIDAGKNLLSQADAKSSDKVLQKRIAELEKEARQAEAKLKEAMKKGEDAQKKATKALDMAMKALDKAEQALSKKEEKKEKEEEEEEEGRNEKTEREDAKLPTRSSPAASSAKIKADPLLGSSDASSDGAQDPSRRAQQGPEIAKEQSTASADLAALNKVVQTTTPRPDPLCKLPPSAPIIKIKKTKDPGCQWQWDGQRGQCKYTLVGTCNEYFHKETGCMFYGHPRNEQRSVDYMYLPPVAGEINLTKKEQHALRLPFQPCLSRPKFYIISTSPLASPAKPLALLAGGAPTMATHVYYVEGEVANDDVYSMSKQKVEDMKVIVDLGANIGLFAISACKRFPNARILSFEPHPGNFRLLVYNVKVAGCKNVEMYNKGVSMDGRIMRLFWHDSIGTSAYRGPTAWEPKPPTLHMDTITPDALWKIVGRNQPVSLMKVDCEGCEYEVVPLIQQWRVERMFCEVHYTTVNILAGHSMIPGMTEKIMKTVEKACTNGKPFNTSLAGRPASLE